MMGVYKNRLRHSGLHDDLDDLYMSGALPFINGTWYFVDPENGDNSEEGTTITKAVADLQTAYGLCTTGDGDGIVLISSGVTGATTTSYLDTPLTWSKWGITVVGICAGGMMGHRARVTSVTRTTGSLTTIAFPTATTITDSASGFVTAGFEVGNLINIDATDATNDGQAIITAVSAGTITCAASTFTIQTAVVAGVTIITSYMTRLITVTGSNNSFTNILFSNEDANALSIGCIEIQGNRNVFAGCQIYGAVNATPAATTGAFDLRMNSAAENTFYGCTIGGNTIIKAATNGCISFANGNGQNHWIDCTIMSYSATATHGAIISEAAGSMGGTEIFKRCTFINWKPNGASALTSAFIGTKPTSGYMLMDSCTLFGWTAWDSVGGNDCVYVGNSSAIALGAGGIATTV